MQSYKELRVWQESMELSVEIYKITKNFPKDELYGLVSQMRRSVTSIPSNIAEGQRRGHRGEYVHFLHIAYGSAAELETQIDLAFRIEYLSEVEYQLLVSKVEVVLRMLNKLLQKLQPTTHNLQPVL